MNLEALCAEYTHVIAILSEGPSCGVCGMGNRILAPHSMAVLFPTSRIMRFICKNGT